MQSKLFVSALALAIAGIAQAQSAVTLDTINVNIGQEGAKNKTNIVTKETLDKRTDNDLRGALREEPSISFGGGNSTSQWLTIRGIAQEHIDFKVDNTYMDMQMFHHQGRFMSDPSLIKIVSIQKGSGSASAGIGATSGSIVAETVSASDLLQEGKSFGGRVQAGVSSNKGHQYGVSVFGRAGGLDALVVTNFNKRDDYKGGNGYRNLNGQRIIQNSALDQRGLLAKFDYNFNPDHRATLSFRQERDTGWRALREEFDFGNAYLGVARTGLTEAQKALGYTVEAGTNLLLDKDGRYIVNNANNLPRYREATQNTVNLAYDGQNLGFVSRVKANVYNIETKRVEPNEGMNIKMNARGFNINLDSALGDNHLLKYGVNYRYEDTVPTSVTNKAVTSKQSKKDTGLYAEGIWGLGQFTLTTGVRYDHFNLTATDGSKVSKGHINPSIGVIYDVNDRLHLSASHNHATRSPRLYEAMLSGRTVTHATADLKAERAHNTEIGFDYDVTDNFSLEGSYFWQTIKGTLAYSAKDGINHYINGGKLKNSGYELGARYHLDNGLRFNVGVAYSKPKQDGRVADAPAMAMPVGRTWTAGVGYKFENAKLEVGYRGRFVENGGYQQPSRGSSSSTDLVNRAGYGVSDLYANWEPMKDLNVNLSINNLFDKNYRPHSQRAGASALAEAGRDVRLNFNYSF
ncbi:MAG: TonB-dependent receptor [Cardiobacteriaceae bacterium]|nr:TonB-dependent receptor [Cardiobacteriaceae bacterium]